MGELEVKCGRVLEVGGLKLVGRGREQFVQFIDTSFSTLPEPERKSRLERILKQAISLWNEIRRPEYELIVFRCFGRFIWRPEHSWMLNVLRWLMRVFLRLCLLRRRTQAQLVVIDLVDEMTIDRLDLWLLECCDLYFKRELSQNVWTTLQRVQPPYEEYNSLPANPRFRRLAEKFRPISIGITGAHLIELREREPQKPDTVMKRYDLFFAGAVEHSTVRQAGLQWLEKLQQEGYAVYLSTQRIDQQLFDELLSSSWLCWSPEGSGWDCYRHYEACLAGSVPVINFPTIQRFAPLIHGVHCFYYAVEGDDLFQIVRAALTARYRLKEMAAAAREHVLAHHTPDRAGDYILAESMSARSLVLSRRLVRHSSGNGDEGGTPAPAGTSSSSYGSASAEEVNYE